MKTAEARGAEVGAPMAQVASALERCGLTIGQTLRLSGREAVRSEIPPRLAAELQPLLKEWYPRGLHSHQSAAIDALLDGEDVCIATATASGKSLVFMAAAANLLLQDRSARVLALYPARALIQDQREKWASILGPLGLTFSHIDGGVPMAERSERLASCQVVLMTPDVLHAWMMSHLGDDSVRDFLASVRLLVLDETHVYEGAFGTNMAYLLRRLDAVTERPQLVCSTATLGEPASFVQELTGRRVVLFGPSEDGSPLPPKDVLLLEGQADTFEATVELLRSLSDSDAGRFLAFANSRKAGSESSPPRTGDNRVTSGGLWMTRGESMRRRGTKRSSTPSSSTSSLPPRCRDRESFLIGPVTRRRIASPSNGR